MVVKVTGRRSPRWAIMSRMVIPSKKNAGETYLVRWRLIQTPWFGVFLHKINEPDYDRDPHDHPWNFTSIVLKGGYTEMIWTDQTDRALGNDQPYRRRWNRWSRHKMDTTRAHRIEKLDAETVTLILVGRRFRDWGFWTTDGWVHWQEYLDVLPGPSERGVME